MNSMNVNPDCGSCWKYPIIWQTKKKKKIGKLKDSLQQKIQLNLKKSYDTELKYYILYMTCQSSKGIHIV